MESRSCDEPVGSVGLGTTVQGTLSALSCMNFGSYFADPWTFTLAEAGSLVIDLQSPDFDTYLLLQDATGQYVAEDDDGGTNLNSRIAGSFQAGTYTIWVTSFSAGETGSYTLSVSRNAPQALESSTLQNLAGLRASDFNLRPLTDVVPTKPHSPRGG